MASSDASTIRTTDSDDDGFIKSVAWAKYVLAVKMHFQFRESIEFFFFVFNFWYDYVKQIAYQSIGAVTDDTN